MGSKQPLAGRRRVAHRYSIAALLLALVHSRICSGYALVQRLIFVKCGDTKSHGNAQVLALKFKLLILDKGAEFLRHMGSTGGGAFGQHRNKFLPAPSAQLHP